MSVLLLIILTVFTFGCPVVFAVTGSMFSRRMSTTFALGELGIGMFNVAAEYTIHPGAGHTYAFVLSIIAGLLTVLLSLVAWAAGEN